MAPVDIHIFSVPSEILGLGRTKNTHVAGAKECGNFAPCIEQTH